MKKFVAILTCVIMLAAMMVVNVSAVSRNYNAPLSAYTNQGPTKGNANTILYETFDSASSSDAVGFFATYEEEVLNKGKDNEIEYRIPTCTVAVATDKHHSGSKSLKVSNRKAVNKADNGEHTFICTSLYYQLNTKTAYASQKYTNGSGKPSKAYTFTEKNIAKVDLGAKITKNHGADKPSRDGKAKYECDTYYFMAWVYTDTKQTFLPILSYGYSGEIWIPNDDYYEVPAKTWTLVGGYVETDGTLYYGSMLGDNVFYRDADSPTGTVASGIYPPVSTTTYVQLRMVTKYKNPNGPKDKDGNPTETIYTDGDFYIDDVALWKVTDTSKLFNYDEKNKCIVDISGKPVAKKTTKTTAKQSSSKTTKKQSSNVTTKKAGTVTTKKGSGTTPTKGNGSPVTSTVEVVEEVSGKFNATGDGQNAVVNIADGETIPSVVADVYVNNKPVTNYSYNAENGDLTFDKAPAKGAKIAVNYYAAEGQMEVQGTGDKVLNFTNQVTEDQAIIPDAIKAITVDGNAVKASDYKYNSETGDCQFKNAPAAGSSVVVDYYTNTVITEEPAPEESEDVTEDSQPEESSQSTTPTSVNSEADPSTGDDSGFGGANWYLILGAVIAFAAILFDILVIVAISVFKKWTNSYSSYYENYYNNYGDGSNGGDYNDFTQN